MGHANHQVRPQTRGVVMGSVPPERVRRIAERLECFFGLEEELSSRKESIYGGDSIGKQIGQFLQHGVARQAVVGKDADLDQAVGLERRVGFFFYGRGQPVSTDHDDRIQVVSFGAVHLALGRGKLNGGHPRIIEGRKQPLETPAASKANTAARSTGGHP